MFTIGDTHADYDGKVNGSTVNVPQLLQQSWMAEGVMAVHSLPLTSWATEQMKDYLKDQVSLGATVETAM